MVTSTPIPTFSPTLRLSLAVPALFIATVFWGAGIVLSKLGLDYFPPLFLLIVQLSASCLILWGVIVVRGEWSQLTWRKAAHGWSGLLEPGLSHILETFGLLLTSVSNASLISATEPVAAMIVAWIVLRERLPRRTLVLIGIALVGTLLLSAASSDSGSTPGGDLLVMLGTLSAAGYIIASRNSVLHMSPLLLAALQQTAALVMTLMIWVVTLPAGELEQLTSIPASAWVLVVVSGIIEYTLAFWLYLYALRSLSASRAAAFLMLVPLFGVAGGVMFLRETLSVFQFIGGVLVLVALSFIRRNEDGPAPEGRAAASPEGTAYPDSAAPCPPLAQTAGTA